MKEVMEIEGAELERELRSTAEPVLVHFHTSWCGPCRILTPSLEGLADDLEDQLQIGRVNLDRRPELAARYGITDVPTLILFDRGAPIERFVGLPPQRELKARLEGVLADYSEPVAD